MWLFSLLTLIVVVAMTSVSHANPLIRAMVYPAPRIAVPKSPPEPFSTFDLSSGNNTRISAWYLLSGERSDTIPLVCFFHGNGENLQTMRLSGTFYKFRDLGVHVVALDYPGYGNSTGKASESSILEAADSLMVHLKSEFPHNPVFIAGWSLGAAVAIGIAAHWRESISGLIILSPWTTLPHVAAVHYPNWLVKLFLKETWDSLERAKTLSIPSLVIHGAEDKIIPSSQGRIVADALTNLRHFQMVANCGHNDLLDHPSVWRDIRNFIHSAGGN